MDSTEKYFIDERVGKAGTVVKLIAYSRSVSDPNSTIATFECEYWRPIHSELMTHRVLSLNASSSRAVNAKSMREQAASGNVYPNYWGLNQAGMQSYKEHPDTTLCKNSWDHVRSELIYHYDMLDKLGLHKQIINRILEPVTKIKTVITATEFDNMFYLRLQDDVEPNMHELVELMHDLLKTNHDAAEWLENGQWHTPYVKHTSVNDKFAYIIGEQVVTQEDALAVSTSCCAQVSYRKIDYSKEKALSIYDKLHIGTSHGHHSPTEHQATPMKQPFAEGKCTLPMPDEWEEGVTHIDRNCNFWSGNFKGWIQHRQLIPNNVCNNYEATTMGE